MAKGKARTEAYACLPVHGPIRVEWIMERLILPLFGGSSDGYGMTFKRLLGIMYVVGTREDLVIALPVLKREPWRTGDRKAGGK